MIYQLAVKKTQNTENLICSIYDKAVALNLSEICEAALYSGAYA